MEMVFAKDSLTISRCEIRCGYCNKTYLVNENHNCMEGIVARVERLENMLGMGGG